MGDNQDKDVPKWEIDPLTGFALQRLFPIDKKQDILKLLLLKPMLITIACRQLNVPKREFYRAKEFDKKFSEELDYIKGKHLDEIEQVLWENAKDPKGVSDRKMLLIAHRPSVYSNKSTVEITGNTQLLELVEKAKKYKEAIIKKVV